MGAWKTAVFATLLLAQLMTAACSRKPAVESLGESSSGNPQLPFERAPNREGLPPTTSIRFRGIPAGTLVTVRLLSHLSSLSSRAGEPFAAVLDQPIIIEGKTVVPRGARIAGRIVSARPSDGSQHSGYLRLTLSTMAVDGQLQAIQTNSVFNKGGVHPSAALLGSINLASNRDRGDEKTPAAKDVQFAAGSRFTFRLKQALPGQS